LGKNENTILFYNRFTKPSSTQKPAHGCRKTSEISTG